VANNAQKTPIGRTLNQFAESKVRGALEQLGKALPASVVSRQGGIVTVKFEITTPYTLPNVIVPMIGSEYIRLPIQPGCLGWVMSADAYLGGMSGLGGGSADISQRANLSCLVWSPIGNKNWSASEDDNALVLYGPDGAILRNVAKTAVLTVQTDKVQLDIPAGVIFVINGPTQLNGDLMLQGTIKSPAGSTYAGNIQTAGDVIAKVGTAPVTLSGHQHSQGNDSHGDTEVPVNAPTPGT